MDDHFGNRFLWSRHYKSTLVTREFNLIFQTIFPSNQDGGWVDRIFLSPGPRALHDSPAPRELEGREIIPLFNQKWIELQIQLKMFVKI